MLVYTDEEASTVSFLEITSEASPKEKARDEEP